MSRETEETGKKPGENGTREGRPTSRREAVRKIGHYGAFTSPVLIKLLINKRAATGSQ